MEVDHCGPWSVSLGNSNLEGLKKRLRLAQTLVEFRNWYITDTNIECTPNGYAFPYFFWYRDVNVCGSRVCWLSLAGSGHTPSPLLVLSVTKQQLSYA